MKAYEQTLRFLNYGSYTVYEIEKKLKDKKVFTEDEIAAALETAVSSGFLNDKVYAENYVEKYGLLKSALRIKLDLKNRGVNLHYIKEALEQKPPDFDGALIYANRNPRKDKEQLGRALEFRGYDYATIRKVIDLQFNQ